MDTLTHALSGALAARVAAPNSKRAVATRECVVLGALAAAFPDTDIVLSALSPLAYLYHHRGVTHSVLLLPLWALLLAGCWSVVRRNRAGFAVYFRICAIALGAHIVGDLITSFGTMIYAPFSDARIEWGTTFIIDPWFSAIIVAALLLAWLFRASRIPALLGVLALCGYVGLQSVQKERAIAFGMAYANNVGLTAAQVSALPRPVSPFNWMVIVTDRERYHYAFVNLRRRERLGTAEDMGFIARLDAQYEPLAEARWQSQARFGVGDERVVAEQVWRRPEFAFFRWFAVYPVLAGIEHRNPAVCVWFRDLRFLTPGRGAWPFRYGMCREEGGAWSVYAYPPEEQPRRVDTRS